MTNKTEALKLALEAFEADASNENFLVLKHCVREALADSALERMAENARELGLDYEPPCKTGSQCTNKCQQCEHPAQQEPHGWYIDGYGAVLGASEPKSVRPGEWLPLYTSPPTSKPLTDEINQIAEDLRFHGLTLVKTVTGYAVLKLGHVAAHAKGDA